MSKINARSPFYLSYTTPTAPTPEFTCAIANAIGFEVDQEGVIKEPTLSFGSISSFTSSDSGFSNGKYATVSTATTRTVVFKINIPSDFSNSALATLDCSLQAIQPAKVTSGATPSCSGGPTTNSSIPNQSIASGGNTVTINLASYFTQGSSAIAGYTPVNYHPSFVQMSITGSTLTLTSLNVGGVNTVYVRAFDNDANTCTAVQAIQVTVTVSAAFDCAAAGLQGGNITQAGVITNPNLIGNITEIRATSGGSAITSVAANSSSSAQNVTLFFLITAPNGYSNAGSSIECSKTFSQAGTTAPAFTCDDANLSGQAIYDTGSIKIGTSEKGTIASFTPSSFSNNITIDTSRSVTFNITIPSGFASAGGTLNCTKTLLQPAPLADLGTVSYYIATDYYGSDVADFCQSGASLQRTTQVKSTATNITTATNHTVAATDASGNATRLFNGGGYYYVVDTFINRSPISPDSGDFFIWRISQNGVITENYRWNCAGGEDGNGRQL